MRIELNSGGLGGTASLSIMQSEITAFIGGADTFLTALKSIKSYSYNMNGGVGSLQEALGGIESRIQTAETASGNIISVRDKIGAFIELTRTVDLSVSGLVNRNKHEFYDLNEWSRPPQKEAEKEWYEKLYDWACGVGDSIAETAQKAWNGIKSFCSSAKEKLDELFAGFQEWWKDHMTITPIVIEDDVFDSSKEGRSTGYYGADQGRPANIAIIDGNLTDYGQDYKDTIIENTGIDDLSDEDLQTYLDTLNSKGCGYAAITNTIFEYYCNRTNGEQEFYEKFGFHMRRDDGNLNFDRVIVDLYSKTNGFNHQSVSSDTLEMILTDYMSDSGANVKVEKNVKITSKNYDNFVREGKQVVVLGWDFPLYYDENKTQKRICGGHGMVVTGVTENGLLIVSTWGGKAYIDPKDNKKLVFNSDGNLSKTKITFQTVEIE